MGLSGGVGKLGEHAFQSATELVAAVGRGEITSVELTETFISRIEAHDEKINAVVVCDFDRALEAARTADEAQARGESLGPLHGLPMTIKEAYDLEGLPTTWGVPEFKDNIAARDSESVRRFKAAGAHFLGKTNVPLALADFQTFNDIYGTTNNPWDLTRTPGGSSGGSAAALASGLTALEAGSDIGGSIRNPAHYCGVYGHKPTWGVVPPQGHALPPAIAPPDIAVVGPMARSAEDLALSMDVVAGADPMNEAGWELRLPRPTKTSLSEFRVAIWPDDEHAPVSTEIADRVRQLADTLAGLGATVSDRARPELDIAHCLLTYQYLLWGVMAAGAPDEVHEARRVEAAGTAVDDVSIKALLARAAVQDHREWLRHDNHRFAIRQAWSAFFDSWDILICPQMPTVAFPHDHGGYLDRTLSIDGEDHDYFDQINWAGLITVAHLPSTVFPAGQSADGLPIGLQAVGREFDDYVTIDFARLFAREIGGFVSPPGFE